MAQGQREQLLPAILLNRTEGRTNVAGKGAGRRSFSLLCDCPAKGACYFRGMKKHYYLWLAVFGLAMIPVVFWGITRVSMVRVVIQYGLHLQVLLSLAIGACATLCVGYIADKKCNESKPKLWKTTAVSILVYTFAVVIWCAASTLISMDYSQSFAGIGRHLDKYAWEPGFYLLAIGVPCAAMVGLVYFGLSRLRARFC